MEMGEREREGKERWAGFGTQTSLFCERYTGQGCSRSHVMLDGFQWGVCDRMRSSGRGGWVCWGRHMYQVVMQECHAPYQCCIRMLCVCVCARPLVYMSSRSLMALCCSLPHKPPPNSRSLMFNCICHSL